MHIHRYVYMYIYIYCDSISLHQPVVNHHVEQTLKHGREHDHPQHIGSGVPEVGGLRDSLCADAIWSGAWSLIEARELPCGRWPLQCSPRRLAQSTQTFGVRGRGKRSCLLAQVVIVGGLLPVYPGIRSQLIYYMVKIYYVCMYLYIYI